MSSPGRRQAGACPPEVIDMPSSLLKAILLMAALGGTVSAAGANPLDDAALRAYAARPWDKARLMGRTVQLGRHHGVPVVAEFPCADVCPQYTVRIIHYVLPDGESCESVGGVEQGVDVPVAITMMPRTFCFPKLLFDAGQHYVR
jgi:hypothetical protein